MNILIVDDELIETQALKKILLHNYPNIINQISICHNGKDAILAANKEEFDLIFMDIEMPIIDGISSSAQIRLKNKDLLIVMLTAYTDFEYAKKSISNQVFDYITKPYSIQTIRNLMERVKKHLNIIHNTRIEKPKEERELLEVLKENSISKISKYVNEYVEGKVNLGLCLETINQLLELEIEGLLLDPNADILEQSAILIREQLEKIYTRNKNDEANKVIIDYIYILKNIADEMVKLKDDNLISKVKRYVYLNYEKNILLEDIANHVSVSKFYLSRVFKEKTGQNLKDYILKLKMEKAKSMILLGYPIAEIAYRIGFNDSSYFSKCFKKEFGISPSQFKSLDKKGRSL